MSDDYRDLVITDLADENACLHERIVCLEADIRISQELLHATMDALRHQTLLVERQRDQHHRLIDEYRALREELLLRADAA